MIKSSVIIPVNSVTLQGDLVLPDETKGLIIFSHGSGSSRLSPRNILVAEHLWKNNLGTLLFDLLTAEEDRHFENRFDINLLTKRLIGATHWAMEQALLQGLPIGYFGASTGAASALQAAASLGTDIKAVVSRGGRPDLAASALPRVSTPTLLLVGSLDYPVIDMNEQALRALQTEKRLEIIAGATHLFEEPGTLELVAEQAAAWYVTYLIKHEPLVKGVLNI